jgi:hypothetical protein
MVERGTAGVELIDRRSGGVAGGDPRDQANGVALCRKNSLCGYMVRRGGTEELFTGESEGPTVELGIEIPGAVLARLMAAHTPLDVLDAWQARPGVLVRCVSKTNGHDLLPEPLDPFLADPSGPAALGFLAVRPARR